MALRRIVARRKLRQTNDVWPINPAAAKPPANWPGWPDGKRFAVVLTHDVEGASGFAKCQQLMELEQAMGFRSCFNLIPESEEYVADRKFRDSLTKNGFEVGIHDLYHNGKLLWTREDFVKNAKHINRYLKDWGAVGFRAGFMLHNLDWFHELDIAYDASTFDTDPFEPQPDGVNTIFPFWVPSADSNHQPGGGYVELPYTLPQDSTLFLIFKQKNIEVWKQKVDWIVQQGGMALVNVHPDYVHFGKNRGPCPLEFPCSFYKELLDYLSKKYSRQFWNALPSEIAMHTHSQPIKPMPPQIPLQQIRTLNTTDARKKIWIDLDNTPHVPFFEPIIAELERRGYSIMLTARDAFQVCELADRKNLKYKKIGRHNGKNKIIKVVGLFYRAAQLLPTVLSEKPVLAVSHGSRSQIIAANLLRIPSVLLADYEFAKALPTMRPTWEMVPEVIPDDGLYCRKERIRKYPGIKEDVYVPYFRPDSSILQELGIKNGELIITVRPPATEAHYHNPEAEILFEHFMAGATKNSDARLILLPRNKKQESVIREKWPHWFAEDKTVVPKHAVDGLNLLWHSDLVVSGGGTMNREAAALGVPVYSIFRGPTGAVDKYLERENRLVMIANTDQVDHQIHLKKRVRKAIVGSGAQSMLSIVQHIEDILKIHYPA